MSAHSQKRTFVSSLGSVRRDWPGSPWRWPPSSSPRRCVRSYAAGRRSSPGPAQHLDAPAPRPSPQSPAPAYGAAQLRRAIGDGAVAVAAFRLAWSWQQLATDNRYVATAQSPGPRLAILLDEEVGAAALFSPAGHTKVCGNSQTTHCGLAYAWSKLANREGRAMHPGNGGFVKSSDKPAHYDLRVLKPLSLKMARRWCSSPEQAEDIAQEALLRLLVCRRQVQKPNAWFYLVTRRLSARASSRIIRQAEAEMISQTLHPDRRASCRERV